MSAIGIGIGIGARRLGAGGAAAADPIADIEALLPAGSYFWLGDDAVPASGSGALTAWDDRLQSLDIASVIGSAPTIDDDVTLGKRVAIYTNHSHDSPASITIAQPWSYFAVALTANSGAGQRVFVSDAAASQQRFGQNGSDQRVHAGTNLDATSSLDTNYHSWAGLANGASSEIWLDAVSKITGNAGTGAFSSTALRFGKNGAGSQPWNGRIAALILAAGNISADISTIHSKFDEYYGGALP